MGPWPRLLWELLASALSPDLCAACSAPVPMMTAFCNDCARTLVPVREHGQDWTVPFVYGGAIAAAVTRFKYEKRPELARPLSAAMIRALRSHPPPKVDVVVPVPLYPSRLIERGYNQAALLASPVARALGARFAPLALVRTRNTSQQAALDRSERLANVVNAFAVRKIHSLRGLNVLLVDDVSTTGATLRACEAAVKADGSKAVTHAVVARAESLFVRERARDLQARSRPPGNGAGSHREKEDT